jgi:hypothetical protein
MLAGQFTTCSRATGTDLLANLSHVRTVDISSDNNDCLGFVFSPNGDKVVIGTDYAQSVDGGFQNWTLSTNWNLSTLSRTNTVSGNGGFPNASAFNNDGSSFIYTNPTDQKWYRSDCGTNYVYDGSSDANVAHSTAGLRQISWLDSGNTMLVASYTGTLRTASVTSAYNITGYSQTDTANTSTLWGYRAAYAKNVVINGENYILAVDDTSVWNWVLYWWDGNDIDTVELREVVPVSDYSVTRTGSINGFEGMWVAPDASKVYYLDGTGTQFEEWDWL